MKNQVKFPIILVICLGLFQSCKNNDSTQVDAEKPTTEVKDMSSFKAVDMPSTLANGDAFPTDSTTIDEWVSQLSVVNGVETNPNVIGHTWGLWQALTEMTDQSYLGRKLIRLETWYTPQDVMRAGAKGVALEHLDRNDGNLQIRKKFSFGHDDDLNTAAGDISGKVKYSPAMAQKALDGNYFDLKVLQSKIVAGEINTVNFTPNSVMLKPIYRVLTDMNKVEGKEDTYYFNVWSGKSDGGLPLDSFARKINVTTNLEDPAIDNKTTYSIASFIHHKMTAAEAKTYNNSSKEGQQFPDTAQAGDPVILLGSHVSTRESRRWTWQSFYWTENPDNPVFPSSKTIADGRNALQKKLTAPANHYAATIGYSMMSPALPFEGPPVDITKAGVQPVYALNPYIEGTFDASVFPKQDSFYTGSYAKQRYMANVDGITSNCMGCHSQSYYNGQSLGNAVTYFLPDQYINRNAPWFEGSVQLDFAWSLFPGFEPRPSKD